MGMLYINFHKKIIDFLSKTNLNNDFQVDFESLKRSAPVFGTVSPEYMRLPRTLDEVPEPFRGFQSGF